MRAYDPEYVAQVTYPLTGLDTFGALVFHDSQTLKSWADAQFLIELIVGELSLISQTLDEIVALNLGTVYVDFLKIHTDILKENFALAESVEVHVLPKHPRKVIPDNGGWGPQA